MMVGLGARRIVIDRLGVCFSGVVVIRIAVVKCIIIIIVIMITIGSEYHRLIPRVERDERGRSLLTRR